MRSVPGGQLNRRRQVHFGSEGAWGVESTSIGDNWQCGITVPSLSLPPRYKSFSWPVSVNASFLHILRILLLIGHSSRLASITSCISKITQKFRTLLAFRLFRVFYESGKYVRSKTYVSEMHKVQNVKKNRKVTKVMKGHQSLRPRMSS
jgi:hypothetical protein